MTDPAKAGFAYHPPGDLFERDTGRGQLNGQRQSVKTRADRGDRRSIVRGKFEFGQDSLSPLNEEPHGRRAAQRRDIRRRRPNWHLKRRHPIFLLTLDMERRPACGQYFQVRYCQEEGCQVRRSVNHVLDVV